MSVDKLVDSTQLDSDLTSVANAIRAKSGGSGQLAFPAGFVSEIGSIPTGGGGGGVDSAFRVTDYKVPSDKWVINQGIPNYIANGGCLHIKITIPETQVSTDSEVLSIGADSLSAWSPSSNCSIFTAFYKNTGGGNDYSLRLRGSSVNGWIVATNFADANNEVEIKVYSDKLVDVKTNTTYYYDSTPDTGILQFSILKTVMTNLCTHSYISVGCNQMNVRASGKIVSLFAIEAE